MIFLGANNQPTWWIEFAWDANTENDIAGYYIYYKKGNQVEYEYLGKTTKDKTDCIVAKLEPLIDHHFAVSAFDTGGLESELSKDLIFRPGISGDGDSGCFISLIKYKLF